MSLLSWFVDHMHGAGGEGGGDTMQEVRSDAGGTLAGGGTAWGTASGIQLRALWEVVRDEASGQGRARPGGAVGASPDPGGCGKGLVSAG